MSMDIHCDVIRVSAALYERTRVVPMGVWQPYAPVWTGTGGNPVLNNGTLVAQYALVGLTCFVRLALTAGPATTPGAGTYQLTLPFVSSPFRTTFSGYLYRPGRDEFYLGAGVPIALPSDTIQVILAAPSGGSASTIWSATKPSALVAGDALTIAGAYEIGAPV